MIGVNSFSLLSKLLFTFPGWSAGVTVLQQVRSSLTHEQLQTSHRTDWNCCCDLNATRNCTFQMIPTLQSPAVDVVGVGTATGRIIIHNIRLDETLMTFTQDWGPITSLAFRTGTGNSQTFSHTHTHVYSVCLSSSDGPPIVASGSPQGHIAFWDLERRQVVTQQRHVHSTAVAAATFLHGEPLLITTGADNTIKVNEPPETVPITATFSINT